MPKRLRVLFIESEENEVASLSRHLVHAGYQIASGRVDTEAELRKALTNGAWDIILSNYSLPKFNALEALRIVREFHLETPFLIVSEPLGEALAVEILRAGADDYLTKDNLVRLAPTVERKIGHGENQKARLVAEANQQSLQLQLDNERKRLNNILANVPGIVWETIGTPESQNQQVTFVSDYIEQMLGYSVEEWLSSPELSLQIMDPADRVKVDRDTTLAYGASNGISAEFRLRTKDGRFIWVECHSAIIKDENGNTIGHRGVTIDVTDRKRAEQALRKSEAEYRSIFENAVEGIFQATVEGRFIAVNPAMAKILGYSSPEEFIQLRICLSPENYVDPELHKSLQGMLKEKGLVAGFECEVYRKDRSKISTVQNIRAIHNEFGDLLHYEGTVEDVTDRRSLELQLRQSQKLEAVGLLAGGIAHDFNNLLTVVSGYCELSVTKLSEDDPLRRNLKEIMKAAERAGVLTRQLLAFSRKQLLQPRVLDLNSTVTEMEHLLRRLIGENIEFRADLSSELGRVKADPGQMEQVILNLAINSRDAMRSGGEMVIETANVFLNEDNARHHATLSPGAYVMLAVRDNGRGMDDETQSHIFEPFFTTKEKGKGTGLSLPMVYGIIKQSGGSIEVYSEVDRGTTFKIYLPRVDEEAGQERPHVAHDATQGSETVLLVEDEEMVRQLAREVLSESGYRVLTAVNGTAALRVFEEVEGRIDLLLTDIVMPEMGGLELATRLKSLRPGLKVLYMSGYTDNFIVHQGVMDSENFLQKPFVPSSLAQRVLKVLESEP